MSDALQGELDFEATVAVAPEPPLLDRTMISTVVLRELDRALDLHPRWAHPFAGLVFSRARRSYGRAHRDGRIAISTLFLGTSALDDLEDTVRHEFAHLIVGIDEQHGMAWRRVAKALGAVPRATGCSRCEVLEGRMQQAPFTLVAVMASGRELAVKPAFRRSKQYTQYRSSFFGRRYYIEGELVTRFVYSSNGGAR
jgi:hypothetical protein